MIFFDSMINLYIEINLALVGAFFLFWVATKLLTRFQLSISQKYLLSFARGIFIIACISPIVFNSLKLIPPIDFQVAPHEEHLPLISQTPYTKIQTTIQVFILETQTVIQSLLHDAPSTVNRKYGASSSILDDFSYLKSNYSRWLLLLLGVGFFLQCLYFIYHVFAVYRLLNRGFLWRSCRSLHILFSEEISIPFATKVSGKNHIVLPTWMMTHPSYLKVSIAHEGQHHRNGDTTWAIFIQTIKLFCFWNPSIYLWEREFSRLQEFACDEALMSQRNISPYTYGNCILKVAKEASQQYSHLMSVTVLGGKILSGKTKNSQLKQRILRLEAVLNQQQPKMEVKILGGALASLIFIFLGVTHFVGSMNSRQEMFSVPPTNGRITTLFGQTINPITGKEGRFHTGIDIENKMGTPIIATAPGEVMVAQYGALYGLFIEIYHQDDYKTRYTNLSKIGMKIGQHVQQGDVIGWLGNSGKSTKPHLHYEILREGILVDPLKFINPL